MQCGKIAAIRQSDKDRCTPSRTMGEKNLSTTGLVHQRADPLCSSLPPVIHMLLLRCTGTTAVTPFENAPPRRTDYNKSWTSPRQQECHGSLKRATGVRWNYPFDRDLSETTCTAAAAAVVDIKSILCRFIYWRALDASEISSSKNRSDAWGALSHGFTLYMQQYRSTTAVCKHVTDTNHFSNRTVCDQPEAGSCAKRCRPTWAIK